MSREEPGSRQAADGGGTQEPELWSSGQAAIYWGVSSSRARSILAGRGIKRISGYPADQIRAVELRQGARTDLAPRSSKESEKQAMPTRPLTPRSVSALLRNAGFARVGRNPETSPGFAVTESPSGDGAVWVTHTRGDGDAQQAKKEIGAYAEKIAAAGWSVDAKEYELIVTAPDAAEG